MTLSICRCGHKASEHLFMGSCTHMEGLSAMTQCKCPEYDKEQQYLEADE